MILYFFPGACSLADHIALIEAGLSYELIAIDRDKRTKDGRDYLTVNPRGFVPALEDDGFILTENLAILAYIAERGGVLIPEDKLGRWRALEALSYMATSIHAAFGAFFRNASDAEKKAARHTLAKSFAFLDDQMGEGSFLLGNTMSIADPYLFWTLLTALHFDIVIPERLWAFHGRMNREPSIIRALAEEGLPPAVS